MMQHLAFSEEEVAVLEPAGWKVHRIINEPRKCWFMTNASHLEPLEAPLLDMSAAMWLIQEAVRPTAYAPLSGGVLADTLRPGGQLAVFLAQNRDHLFDALNPPDSEAIQPNVSIAELTTWKEVHAVIKDATDRNVPLVTVIIDDAEGSHLLLDFPMKTVALIVAYQARTEDAMSQMQVPEDTGPEDATSH